MRGFTHPSPPRPGSGPWQWGHTGTSPHLDCRLPRSHWSTTSQPPRTRRVLELLSRAAPGTAGLWVLAHPPCRVCPWGAHFTSLGLLSGLQMGTWILTPPPPTTRVAGRVKERLLHSSWRTGGPSSVSWPLYFPSPIYETS